MAATRTMLTFCLSVGPYARIGLSSSGPPVGGECWFGSAMNLGEGRVKRSVHPSPLSHTR